MVRVHRKVSKKVSYHKQIVRQHSWSTLQKFSSHIVTVYVHVWGPKKIENAGTMPLWDWGYGWPPRNMHLIHLCYHTKFGHFMSNHITIIMEIRQKNMTLMSRLSRSLKANGTDTNRLATYDFLLVIHSNHGPISYRFWAKWKFLPKITNFPTPCI